MSEKTIPNKWTKDNLEYLRIAYLRGYSLKSMSAHLNRSVTAINKALSRYNLRTGTSVNSISSVPLKTSFEKAPNKAVSPSQTLPGKRQTFRSLLPDYRHWICFDSVITWLRTQQITIRKSARNVYYEVNGYPKTKQQILYLANVLREEKDLPLFFVKDVTFL